METNLRENRVAGEVSRVQMLNFNTSSVAFKDALSRPDCKVTGLAIMQTHDKETGEMKNASYIIFEDGVIVGGVSSTALDSIENAMDLMDDGDILHAHFEKGTSKSDRTFIKVVWS